MSVKIEEKAEALEDQRRLLFHDNKRGSLPQGKFVRH